MSSFRDGEAVIVWAALRREVSSLIDELTPANGHPPLSSRRCSAQRSPPDSQEVHAVQRNEDEIAECICE